MISKVKLFDFRLLILVFLILGCSDDKDNFEPEPDSQEWQTDREVYAVGYENVQGNDEVRLWKNGKVEKVANETTYGVARSVFVQGNDVYIAGYEWLKKDESGGVMQAKVWKNGKAESLSDGNFFGQAFSVFVEGDDVYVAGREATRPYPYPVSSFNLKYWKNGKEVIIAENVSNWEINSIFVSKGNVYVAGRGSKGATLWKNGVEEDIERSANSWANSVFVSGNDVYVAGHDENVAKLWKNGKAETLSGGKSSSKAYSVYISGNDVFVAGNADNEARLWKNGVVQNIADSKDAQLFYSVFVKGEDVFLAGYVETVVDIGGGMQMGYFKPTIWRNGKALNLSAGKNQSALPYSVFVK